MGLDLRHYLALSLNARLADKAVKAHVLREIFWESTLRCNLNCRHCGSDCKLQPGQKDMPLADFLQVLDRVKAAGMDSHHIMIVVSGGEPLMRQDLEQCGRAFYEREFPWGMVTNGFALTPERFSRLLAAGMRAMTISLDGLEADHDWMRGVPGSFRRAEQAIRMACTVPDLAFDVVTCVNKRNYPHLQEIKEFLIGCGLKQWRLFTVFPAGRAADDPELQLDRDEFRGLMEFIKATRKEGRIKASYGCEGFLGNYEGDVRDNFYFCNAGVSVAGVLSDGSISACTSIRANYHQGNIYKDDFVEVWEKGFLPYRKRDWMKKDDCATCKYWKFCKGNGMHLRDDNGRLITCHYQRIYGK